MGLREKVALTLISIASIQIIFVHCSPRDKTSNKISDSSELKQNIDAGAVTQPSIVITIKPQIRIAKTKSNEGRNHEALRKTFNFPDVEYPAASTPRPPFYLQETNILQRSPVQRASDYLSSTTNPFSTGDNKKGVYKNKHKDKPSYLKTTTKPGITITFAEFGTTPKPYCFREVGAFPDVDYPLSAKDTWTPNYWKPIPTTGSNNQINKNEPDIIPKATGKSSTSQVFGTPNKSTVSKLKPNRTNDKNEQQTPLPLLVNNNQEKVITKGEPDNINQLNQNVTPAPPQSTCTQSTTPFVLTPYTTLYFDTTPSYIDTKVVEDKNKTTTVVPKKTTRKKKTKKKSKKKEDTFTRPKTTSTEQDETYFTSSPLTAHIHETQIGSHKGESLPLSHNTSIPLPEDEFLTTSMPVSILTVMPDEPISKVNLSKSDTCSFKFNDTILSKYVVTTSPSYLCSEIDPTIITIHNNDKVPISNDKKVASISAVSTIEPNSKENNDGSCFVDNITSSKKSSTCVNKINDFLLSCREDEISPPSVDEEFTTDVFPDFDENTLPIFTTSSSTLSPLILNEVDEAWVNSEVIDPYKSLAYPDELEQYYIIVP